MGKQSEKAKIAGGRLQDQLCFSLYAASRLLTRCYQPVLEELGLTYPQYLVLMLLWESDGVSLSFLAENLDLQSNTLTPLLKRMQAAGLVVRVRSKEDERNIVVSLTEKGRVLESEVPRIQQQLEGLGITNGEAHILKELLQKIRGKH